MNFFVGIGSSSINLSTVYGQDLKPGQGGAVSASVSPVFFIKFGKLTDIPAQSRPMLVRGDRNRDYPAHVPLSGCRLDIRTPHRYMLRLSTATLDCVEKCAKMARSEENTKGQEGREGEGEELT